MLSASKGGNNQSVVLAVTAIVDNNSRRSRRCFCALLADSVGLADHALQLIIRARGTVEVREVLLEAERRSHVPAREEALADTCTANSNTGP